MPKIPESYGIVANPSFKTTMAMPDSEASQMTAKLGEQLGGNLMNIATQMQYQSIKEQEAFDTAQIIDFKTKLATFENEKRIALAELPATDPTLFDKTKKSFESERASFINNYTNQYKDNARLSSLIKRQADVEAVDFNFDVDKTLLSKKREYGTNKIYEGIYSINQRLEKGGNPAKLSNELNTILQSGLKAGLIDQNDINREKEKQKAIIQELQIQYEKTRQANLVASGQLIINPSDANDKKIGDLAYQKILTNNTKQGIDPIVSTMSFIQKTGYIPSEVKNIWNSQLNVGNPQQKLETALNIANLIEVNSRLQNQFNSDDINFAMEIKKRSQGGLPAQQIIEYSEKEISKYQSMDRIAKLQIFNEKDSKKNIENNFEDFIDENFKPIFSSNPTIKDNLKITFEQIVKDQFVNNKNATLEGSVEYAKNVIKNEYTITDIGKKKLMRYAPETFFSKYNNGDTSWIKEQFAYKIIENKAVNSLKELDDDFTLIPHPNFIAGGKPSYFVAHKVGDYGREEVILGANNRPIMFTPNIEEADFYKEQKKQFEKDTKTPFTKEEALNILEGKAKTGFKNKSLTPPITNENIKKEAIKNTLTINKEIQNIDEKKPLSDLQKKVNNYLDKINIYKEQLFGTDTPLPQDKPFEETRFGKLLDKNIGTIQNIKNTAEGMGRNINQYLDSIDTPLPQDKPFEETRIAKINKEKIANIFKNLQITQDEIKKLTAEETEIDKMAKYVENFKENPNNKEIKIVKEKNEKIKNWQEKMSKFKQDFSNYNNELSSEINKIGASFSQYIGGVKERIMNPKKAEIKEEEIAFKEAEKFIKENPQIEKLAKKAINDLTEYGIEDSLSVKAYKKALQKIKKTNPKAYKQLNKTFEDYVYTAEIQKRAVSDKVLKKLKLSNDYFAKGLQNETDYIDIKIQELKNTDNAN